MPIHPPGEKFRKNRLLRKRAGKRDVTATLSLTAMVDMFTVLVVFLLQNFNPDTNAVLYIPKEVTLPKAEQIKNLKPSVIVTVSNKNVVVNDNPVATFEEIKAQSDWLVKPLYLETNKALKIAKQDFDKKLQVRLKEVVDPKAPDSTEITWNKVTIQADKSVDFLTVKKVMFTVTEAGAAEINFAVMKETTTN